MKTCFPEPIQIDFKFLTGYQLILAVNFFWETIDITYIIQYGEENNKQLFIKVYLSFLVYRIKIDGLPVLYDCIGGCNSTGSVYFVQTAVLVLYYKENKVSVITIELY